MPADVIPWRVWRAAAVADSRALRHLPAGVSHRPTNLQAALDDALYLIGRQRENERVKKWREHDRHRNTGDHRLPT